MNKQEVGYLLQYSINNLMAMGAIFDIQGDSEENRIKMPIDATLQ